jgi:hypothetical protein
VWVIFIFGEMSVQVTWPFFSGVTCFSTVGLHEALDILDISLLSHIWFVNIL